jgi:hypothetical protein
MTSYNKPTNEQLDAAIPLLSSPQHEAYFFARLENPNWIGPLAERDVFCHPPRVEHVQAGGVRFPAWPPSQYLARMAPKAPTEVAAILANLETENPSVVGDTLRAALAMPPEVAVSLVPPICRAAREGILWIHFKDASDLCVRLAKGGEFHTAQKFAEALFTPSFEVGQGEPRRRDAYWYKKGLSEVVPLLAPVRPREFVPKLCDWLTKCVEAKRHVDPESGCDYSYVWRPAVEEHEQNRDYDFAGGMVGFVREGFEQAVRSGSLTLDDALKILERYSYLVFRRIRLHLISEFANQNPELARQTILTRELLDDYKYKHEYAMLVSRRLDLLSPEQRDEWFGWIEAGPDMSDYDESIKKNLGRDATEKDRQGRIRYWQFQKLHWVRAHVPGERRKFYEEMVAQHGEPQLADLNVYVGSGRWGHDSPVTVDQLKSKTFEEVVDEVSLWRPEESDLTGPSVEGLASTFEQFVATNPDEFSAKARIMVNRPAIFVRGFVSKMTEAINRGREINLSAVLELCHWIVERPVEERTTPRQPHGHLVDENWQWTREEVCRFVESVCKAEKEDGPKHPLDALRESMWKLIAQLCRDRADSSIVHDLSATDPRDYDYLDLAINSPRGNAVEAALEYARWVANHVKESRGKQEVVLGGFDVMPEVQEMLEWQIAPENRSFVALAVIGSRIGLIYWIDKTWLAENAAQLFRLEDIEETPVAAHGWAAWNAFLVWVRPHIEFYRIFESQFEFAVEHAAKIELNEQSREQPMHHLGEHLMVLYGRGQLAGDEGLLKRFLENANPDVRRHAMGFVGQSLEGDEQVSPDIVERFEKLWDLYWAGAGRNDAGEAPYAWLFGTWFSCGKFSEPWALDRLHQFVEVSPIPQPDDEIVDKLSEMAHIDVVKSVQILDKMVRGDREGWRIHSWETGAKDILEQALNATAEARETAEKLIDYLGRRGYMEFGRVLSSRLPSG